MNEETLRKLREGPSKPPRSTKHILIRDIESCPYVPKDPEYNEWCRKDDERLETISRGRENLRILAHQYLSHEDKIVREMALFITWFLRGE